VSIISLTTIFWGENFVVLVFFKPVKSLQKVSKRWSFPTQRALLCPKLARGVREIIQRPVGDFPLPFALVPWGQYLSYTNLSGRIWIIPACPRCLSPWLFGAHDCSVPMTVPHDCCDNTPTSTPTSLIQTSRVDNPLQIVTF
jgi:hypothetical protein